MTVIVGDNLPQGSLWEFDNSKGVGSPKKLAVSELINGKKIVESLNIANSASVVFHYIHINKAKS